MKQPMPPAITKGKRREIAPPPMPAPAEVEPRAAFVGEDEGGATVVLAPAGDAFELWLHRPGAGAVAVSLAPSTVLRMAWWVVISWWVGVTYCGLRTYIALRRARKAAMRATETATHP